MKHILITGGAGFIGGHLCRKLLSTGFCVTVVDNFDPFYPRQVKEKGISDLKASPHFSLLVCDINDVNRQLKALSGQRVEAIIHLAAKAGVRPSLADPIGYQEANVKGTLSMLEVARRLGVQVFVNGSSSSVYGNNKSVPFKESDPVEAPISPYAATKRAGELLAYTYHHLYQMRIHCLRFFTVYGPWQRPDLAIHKFSRLMTRGEPITMYGDGSTSRDYTFVDDIVQGVTASLDRLFQREEPEYEIFNLGGARVTSLGELISGLSEVLGVNPILEQHPMQPGDVNRTYADLTKSREMLGYAPQVPIEEGLKRFASWFVKEYSLVHAMSGGRG